MSFLKVSSPGYYDMQDPVSLETRLTCYLFNIIIAVGRGKYNKRGRGRGGGGRRGRESSWKDGSDDTSSEEEVVYRK